jgi:16S rRNA (cytosine1402-N4)-methyltransferase
MLQVKEKIIKMKQEILHYPVMYREVLELLDIRNKKFIIDCTLGIGSHALKFLEVMLQGSYLVGIDKDESSLKIANSRLTKFESRFTLIKGDFSNLNNILDNLKMSAPDAIFFDLGISMYQLQDDERGFSFLKDGPLDMRMDRDAFLSAYELINNLGEIELEEIFRKFGEERFAHKIAKRIIEGRKHEPIATTAKLTRIILEALPQASFKYKIHPATRIFQALRIAVNRELEVLKTGIEKAIDALNCGGKIAVISFHSLEDRIVKHTFKDYSSRGLLRILTKKPIKPQQDELLDNHASRSAKLRVAEKII